ncbi:hypothetical protein LR48_Vigan11g054800 [Vigna angularis]|uniref:Uncharacterized protein n=1 Tax=Phaseolus angularis TaxID=3914 RepID=A0A0L9VR33_PHAAN|nr:hypothetical protein LR48_Vigan11g054800 [Vigna angularis]
MAESPHSSGDEVPTTSRRMRGAMRLRQLILRRNAEAHFILELERCSTLKKKSRPALEGQQLGPAGIKNVIRSAVWKEQQEVHGQREHHAPATSMFQQRPPIQKQLTVQQRRQCPAATKCEAKGWIEGDGVHGLISAGSNRRNLGKAGMV